MVARTRPHRLPSDHRFFSDGYAAHGLELGIRRPTWCWAAIDERGAQLGLIAAQAGPSIGIPQVIDVLGVPDRPDVGVRFLVAAATDIHDECGVAEVEMNLSTPVDDDPLRRFRAPSIDRTSVWRVGDLHEPRPTRRTTLRVHTHLCHS